MPGNPLLSGLGVGVIPPLLLLILAALVSAFLTFNGERRAKRWVLTVALAGSGMFALLTMLSLPLLLLAADTTQRAAHLRLWLTLGVQPLVLILALF